MLKQRDVITAEIIGLGSNGEGVCKYEDYTIFTPFSAIGDVLEIEITFAKRQIAYGKVVRVVTKSKDRVDAPCRVFGKCGGCQLQHLDIVAEEAYKHNKVEDNLRKIAGVEIDVLPTVSSPKEYGYRNKLSMPIREIDGDIVCGFYEQNTHKIVDCAECVLQEEWAKKVTCAIKEYVKTSCIQAYSESDFTGVARQVVARYVDNQLLVVLVVNGRTEPNCEPLIELLKKQFSKFGLFINFNSAYNNVILGKETKHIYGIPAIGSEEFGVKYFLQPKSFFQVNDGVRKLLYNKVKTLISECKTELLIDAFSGVGLLTGALYSDQYATVAIEIEPTAVADANTLKYTNNLVKLTNICGDVNDELIKVDCRGRLTTLVVDPPRKGLGTETRDAILTSKPQHIIYISCDSATLARDIKTLLPLYRVARVEPYNMFPKTDDVETLVLLSLID